MIVLARLLLAGAAGTALVACASVPTSRTAPAPAIAITIDDLPVHGPMPRGDTRQGIAKDVIRALKAEGAEAHGFVNGAKLDDEPATLSVLESWRAAGFALANHGWSHKRLSEMSVEEFEREVAANEPLLKQLAEQTDWRWFRFPFLDEGGSAEKRAAARQVLARRGYRVAAVTMDFSDWQWTAPYARCMDVGDLAAVERMEDMFLNAVRENIAYSRARARIAAGGDIPYVLLMHISAFEARMLPRVLRTYREAGFRFVSLAEAQRDPFYAIHNDPALRLPPPPQRDETASPLPQRTDFASMLEAICR